MAHLHDDDENRFTKKVLEGVDAAKAREIIKGAGELRKEISSLKTRIDGNEEAILAAVKKIAKRLDALEKAPGLAAKAQVLGAELADVTPARRVELLQAARAAVALNS
jgi:hypothetical protein